MQTALRPYVTAGVAVVGASVIVVTPVAAPPPSLPDIQSRAVQLTAGEDASNLFPALTEIPADLKQLSANFLFAPEVGLQQLIANLAGLNTPEGGTAPTFADELATIQASLTLTQPSGMDDDTFADVVSATTNHTLAGGLGQSLFINEGLLGLLLPPDTAAEIVSITTLLSSPLTGILMGLVGPFLAPGAQVIDVIEDLVGLAQGDVDPTQVLTDLLAVPTAFLTGSVLNLDFLTSLIPADALPEGVSIDALSFGFGGLLSTGSVGAGDYSVVTDASTDPVTTTSITAVGGSILNSVGIGIDNPTLPITIDAHPIGPIGAMIGLQQALSQALGMNWGGKNAPPLEAPLLGLQPFNDSGLQELLGNSDSGGDSSAAVSSALTDLLSGNWDQAFTDIF